VGFQRRLMTYSEKMSYALPSEPFSYVEDLVAVKDTSQGAYVRTENPLHVFLRGEGYFALQTPAGVRYSRAGAFTLDQESRLISPEGHLVLNEGFSPITLPEGNQSIVIASDGTISDEKGAIAQLGVFTFENPYDVKDEEGTLITTEQMPQSATNISLVQYGYEGSNTNSILEAQRLIELTRAYQYFEKIIEEQHRLQSQAIATYSKSMTT
jgi:flagellar basal-body rod protein FlgF